ncbi:Hypothetical protein CINCED_3A018466 [Cinara cedri]|uniref:Uncharacterized protein n=1 Tax=Cinara cedri TaxID=506608 RepID=A0A5E4MB84_9HEMI|nr:Hypothetical protein CINCED_3A018466 [Cinara cedri]
MASFHRESILSTLDLSDLVLSIVPVPCPANAFTIERCYYVSLTERFSRIQIGLLFLQDFFGSKIYQKNTETFCTAAFLQLSTFHLHIMGLFLLGYVVYTRLDTVLQEWIDALKIWQVYLGLYVLIFVSIIVVIAPFLSCFAVYQEINQLLMAYNISVSAVARARLYRDGGTARTNDSGARKLIGSQNETKQKQITKLRNYRALS